MSVVVNSSKYLLKNNWTYYLHLHDTRDWSIDSYNNILRFHCAEDAILLNDEIHYDLIKKSMMFLMKEDIKPMWEDENNKNGGCFSFKVLNKRCTVIVKWNFNALALLTTTKQLYL